MGENGFGWGVWKQILEEKNKEFSVYCKSLRCQERSGLERRHKFGNHTHDNSNLYVWHLMAYHLEKVKREQNKHKNHY